MVPVTSLMFCLQTELSDGIANLVASNDHVQELITQMENVRRAVEVRNTQKVLHGSRSRICSSGL